MDFHSLFSMKTMGKRIFDFFSQYTITKTSLFKYTEHFTTTKKKKKMKIFG